MSKAVENVIKAQQYAMSIRPKIGGFPNFAEGLRKAGITQNIWHLPSCQSIYLTQFGSVAYQGTPLINAIVDVPPFDRSSIIKALKDDQTGLTSFPEFLNAAWQAGVVSYIVDFEKRSVSYFGVLGECYTEAYPAIEIDETHMVPLKDGK